MDMNVGRPARILSNIHRKPAHTICINGGSAFVTHPMEAYNVFMTVAVGDGINMWDLRTERYANPLL